MASKVLQHFHEVSHCPVCKDVLSQPRLISCGHTFCLGCLQGMYINGPSSINRDLKCPLCSTVTKLPKGGAEKFPFNYMAEQVKTAVDEARESMKHTCCHVCCEKTTQGVFCSSCEAVLCPNCEVKHVQTFPEHSVNSCLEDVPTLLCHQHPGKLITFFCPPCSEAICQLCATRHHAGSLHRVIPLTEAKDHFIREARENMDVLKGRQNSLRDALDAAEKQRNEAVTNFHVQKGFIERAAQNAIRKIKEEEGELMNQIQARHDSNIRNLDAFEQSTEENINSLNETLQMSTEALNGIQISNFFTARHELDRILEKSVQDSAIAQLKPQVQDYSFSGSEGATAGLGSISLPPGQANTDLDLQKPFSFENLLEVEEQIEDGSDVRMRVKKSSDFTPRPVPSLIVEETRLKLYHLETPMLIGSFTLGSGVQHIPMTIVGIGVLQNQDVICAYNTNRMGQVVLCTQPDKHQVIYHSRKGIAAFALYNDEECGIVLEDDCSIKRLVLIDIPAEGEVQCTTQKISCKAANISALAYDPRGVMIISDTDKNCLTGVDRQSRHPFRLNGNMKEERGGFTCTKSLTAGPEGEIILYDSEKRRCVIFSSNTKFLRYINLPDLSPECSLVCDELGVLYIADAKQSKVFRTSISGEEPTTEFLSKDNGLQSPRCVSVRGRFVAVANSTAFSEGEVRVFELVGNRMSQV